MVLLMPLTSVGQQVDTYIVEREAGKDTLQLSADKVDSLFSDLYHQGYMDAILDSIVVDSMAYLSIAKGTPHMYGEVHLDTTWDIVRSTYLAPQVLSGRPFRKEELVDWVQPVFDELASVGYPLAGIRPRDVVVKDREVHMTIELLKGKRIVFDTLAIERKGFVSSQLVSQITGIKKGGVYNEKLVNAIRKNINDSQYYRLKDGPSVRIYDNEAIVDLFVQKNPSSRFDFIIGVTPNTVENKTNYTITGDLLVETRNILDRGEYFFLNVKRRSLENQFLKMKAAYPYLLGLPYTVNGQLGIEKNGQNFLNVEGSVGVNTNTVSQYVFGVFAVFKQSSLIEIDSSALLRSGKLPDALDTRYSGGSSEVVFSTLNNALNPTRGLRLSIMPQLGRKQIVANERIKALKNSEHNFSMAYDTLSSASLQGRLDIEIDYYQPIVSAVGLKMTTRLGYIYDKKVLRNDLYRLGGYRLLRGFDEQSVLTDKYIVASVENRFLLGPYSYLSLPFADYSYGHVVKGDTMVWDHAIGAGMGMTFATKVGIFNVSFAVGRRLQNPIDFNKVKVHFGYVSTF